MEIKVRKKTPKQLLTKCVPDIENTHDLYTFRSARKWEELSRLQIRHSDYSLKKTTSSIWLWLHAIIAKLWIIFHSRSLPFCQVTFATQNINLHVLQCLSATTLHSITIFELKCEMCGEKSFDASGYYWNVFSLNWKIRIFVYHKIGFSTK